ncbi:S-layer homology domain-containing protein [Tissierella sp. MB52-C2]|uniref:S-layer homology domain-containing protein n=1 Tax=Tissierella sp. MB52-C2 TaxID=3070999 RepID=UPI00280B2818|nr:S-layer homology domain-containing protein [Tissierella sp. MB52-C2]WMM26778.1 S-layer homology domain-containing protein [Tissierella sp. MB52-C2]
MKRLLSLIFSLVILMSTGIVALGQGSDYEDNWAKSEINYMKNKGILSGYPDGTFRPTNNMNKSEFYKVVNGIMGFTQKSEVNFNDVSPTDWYYDEVQKGVSANYILPGTSLNANENITRGEVARIIGVIFGVEKDKLEASKFTDNLTLPEELKGIVGGLKKNGYINGYPDGTFRANAEITRAEVVKMLYNISGEIVNASGTINKNRNTNLIVNTKDVILKDIIIGGNLYLAEGIGEGNTILDNVVVKGKVIVNGGSNGLSINNSKLNSVSIDKKQGLVNVVLSNTTVEELKTVKQVRLELTKGSYIKKVEVRDKASLISAKDTSIDSLSIVGADVIVDSKGTIKSIKSGAKIKANGSTLKTNVEYKLVNGKLEESNPTVASTKKSTTTKPPTRPDPVTLNRISVKSLPDKLVYTVDDELDITGLVIEGIYSDGSRETERVTKSNIKGFDSRQPAERQALTIKIGGRTTAYTIKIQANDPVKPEVNKRKLAEAIAEAIRKSEEDYTEESWKPFEAALDMAIEINEDNEATQREINQALSELNARMKGLVKREGENPDPEPEEVDKSELIVVIDRAEEKNEEDYTPETWRPFIESLEAAIIVRDNSEATQREIDDAVYELNDKMDELVEEEPSSPEPVVNKSELIDAIDRAERMNKEDYTIETWEELEITLETAIEVIDDLEATQSEVDRALEDLNAAIEGLEIKENSVEPSITNILPDEDIALKAGDILKVSFNAEEGGEAYFRLLLLSDTHRNIMANEKTREYEKNMEEIEPGFYSATWVVREGIKATGLEVEVNFVSKEGEKIEKIAKGRINITMEDPDPVVDKRALEEAIAEAMAKNEDDYTEESWRDFVLALDRAIEVNEDEDVTQEEVTAALWELNDAISALVEKEGPVDPVEEPRVIVEVRNASPILPPALIHLKVEVEDIFNAAKYDVVYQLSGGEERNTSIFDLGTWSTESFFFNPRTITDKVTIRIYDVDENLLYAFEDVVLENPRIPK